MFYKYKGFGYCCFEIDYEDMGMTGDEVGGCFGCGEEEYADNWILELPESAQEDITFHDKAEVEYLLVPEDNPRIKLKCPSFSFKGRIRFYFCEDEPQWRDLVYQEDRKEKTITITADEIISKEKWEAVLKIKQTESSNAKNDLNNQEPTKLKKKSKNELRDNDFKQWLDKTEPKPDLEGMTKKELHNILIQRNGRLWRPDFNGWVKFTELYQGESGRRKGS